MQGFWIYCFAPCPMPHAPCPMPQLRNPVSLRNRVSGKRAIFLFWRSAHLWGAQQAPYVYFLLRFRGFLTDDLFFEGLQLLRQLFARGGAEQIAVDEPSRVAQPN
jgi:hypothetical protein